MKPIWAENTKCFHCWRRRLHKRCFTVALGAQASPEQHAVSRLELYRPVPAIWRKVLPMLQAVRLESVRDATNDYRCHGAGRLVPTIRGLMTLH